MVADAAPERVELVEGDAMTVDYAALLRRCHTSAAVRVVGNLPFNIATPLLLKFLSMVDRQEGICTLAADDPNPNALPIAAASSTSPSTTFTLAFQHEVAQRIVAPPGTPIRSRLSVMAQHYCDVKQVFVIPGRLFVPPPVVDAAVVHFTVRPRLERPGIQSLDDARLVTYEGLEQVARTLFQQRRKLVKHGLSKLLLEEDGSAGNNAAESMVASCGLDPALRTHQLKTEDVVRLTRRWAEIAR
jgi:16S rRNA A1518/A1519 N6-dimethyltransferase RsmA/KsgA/DIM1 with predicted DNA glycosylase/AP lyase activity